MWVLLHLKILSFVTVWVFEFHPNLNFWNLSQFESFSHCEFCHILGLVIIWVLSQFECCQTLSFWVLSQFFFEFDHNLSFWSWSHIEFLSFIFFFVFFLFVFLSFITVSILNSSQFQFLSFIPIWVFEFHPNLSFWVLSKFELLLLFCILFFSDFFFRK